MVGAGGGRLVHLGDLHFGGKADLDQVEALEALVPTLAPAVIVLSGDVTQRARHGEFQRALALVQHFRRTAPVLLVPGNHDVSWWASPFGLAGQGPKYAKYRRYFGPTLGPVLALGGLVAVGTVSAHGLAFGSVTWNPRDLTVKGHLPRSETDRAQAAFRQADPAAFRVLVLHHNVLRGRISNRWGLAHPHEAQRRIAETGAELVLCGHDHEEAVGRIDRRTGGGVVVAAASTHTRMTRGKRPSAFNLVEWTRDEFVVRHVRWSGDTKRFEQGAGQTFPRHTGVT